MKVFLTIVNGIMAVGVVDPNIVNGNGPGGNECPNNSCYEIDEIGVCNVKESCFRVTCTKLGTGIQFKVKNERKSRSVETDFWFDNKFLGRLAVPELQKLSRIGCKGRALHSGRERMGKRVWEWYFLKTSKKSSI